MLRTGWVVGIDGGGTGTRLAVADADGREVVRRRGPAGLVDPREPTASAAMLLELIREAAAEAEIPLPLSALCAGLAGAGTAAVRERVREELAAGGVAERIAIVPDGEIALEGALAGAPGILLVAGTGSVAWGRSEDGRVEHCGGWGRIVGDEGSGYSIARAAIGAALRAADGRGEPTALLSELLAVVDLGAPEEVPAWVGRAEKGEIAALAPRVIRLALSGDAVAGRILEAAVRDLARHVEALIERLGPWSAPVALVFHGGVLQERSLAEGVEARLRSRSVAVARRDSVADPVSGAVRMAGDLLTTG